MSNFYNFFVLSALMLLGCSGFGSAQTFSVDNITYTVNYGEEKTVTAHSIVNPSILNVKIPASVTYDGIDYTVNKVSADNNSWGKLVRLTLPTSLTECTFLGTYAESMVELNVSDLYWLCSLNEKGWGLANNSTQIKLNGKTIVNLEIPEGITSIGCAFMNYSFLRTISFPASLTTIKNSAFSRCKGLTEINIPETITTMGSHAFAGCSNATYISLPGSLDIIQESAFDYCTSVKKVDMQDGVRDIMNKAFYNCSSLEEIRFPETLETIGEDAFRSASKLTQITFPNSVISIGANAFRACSGLLKVEFGCEVMNIGDYCFYLCDNISEVLCPAEDIIPKLSSNSFTWGVFRNATLYVPMDKVEDYKTAPGWSEFSNIQGKDFAGITDIEMDEIDTPAQIFNLNGVRMMNSESLTPGIYIKVQNGKTSKFVVSK